MHHAVYNLQLPVAAVVLPIIKDMINKKVLGFETTYLCLILFYSISDSPYALEPALKLLLLNTEKYYIYLKRELKSI